MDTPSTTVLAALVSPVEKLVDAMARATGVLYQPHHVIKMAKAQARSDLIKANSDIEIEELKRRAEARIESLELRRQANIDLIVKGALLRLSNRTESSPIDIDWVVGFVESCKDVSDQELQQLWSTILTDETCTPGSYRARTLEFLKYITMDDARSFDRLASYVVVLGGVTCLLWDNRPRSFYQDAGIKALELQSLRRAGFLTVQEEYRITKNDKHDIELFDRHILLDAREHSATTVSILLLSPEAEDLLKLTRRTYDERYVQVILNTFKFKKRLKVFLDGDLVSPETKTAQEIKKRGTKGV
jgi:Protein of unknown function (DUF2806)